jgi:Bacterial regulatory proteins, luxR family
MAIRRCGIGGCWRGCAGSSGLRGRQEAKGDGSGRTEPLRSSRPSTLASIPAVGSGTWPIIARRAWQRSHFSRVAAPSWPPCRPHPAPSRLRLHLVPVGHLERVSPASKHRRSTHIHLQISDDGAFSVVALHRARGEREFSPREQRLLRFFHEELGALIGRSLVSDTEPHPAKLSPRLRQTLVCLLEGDSEKQVASRLGLSQATTHQYVTALYRHFGSEPCPAHGACHQAPRAKGMARASHLRQRRPRAHRARSPRCRAMTLRWICVVPPPIVSSSASRT